MVLIILPFLCSGMWSDDRYQAENVEKAPEKSRGDRGEDENVPLESELNYEIGGSAAAARQKLLEAQRMELARVREEYSPLAQSHNTSRKSNILETAQDTLEKTAASVDDLANLHAQVEAATKLTEAAEEDRVHHRHIASAEENGKVVDSILPNTINLKNKIAELVNEEDVDLASTLKQLEDVAIPPLSPEVPSRLEKILEESSPMPPPKESGPAPWPHENQEPDSQEKPPLGAPQQTKLTANKMAASMTDLELENM